MDKVEYEAAAEPNALHHAQAAQARVAELMRQKKGINAELKEAKADYAKHKKAVDAALGKKTRGPRKKQVAIMDAADAKYQEEHPGEATQAPDHATALADSF